MTARRRIVVVGAGSSGCVVAERLSRAGDIDVLLLEAGPETASEADLALARLPVDDGSHRATHHRSVDGHDLARGRGVGGSSAINGGYFMRWHRSDFHGWDRRWWDDAAIASHHERLDGGVNGSDGPDGGSMSVRRLADDELHPRARTFESYWTAAGFDSVAGPWTGVGINRVRVNAGPVTRVSADRVFLTPDVRARSTLQVRTGAEVDTVVIGPDGARGVLVGHDMIAADEVILCAGTLGTAAVLARSGIVGDAGLPLAEHREILVRHRDRPDLTWTRPRDVPLLPTVLHTDDGVEIRCYNNDFADHIDGLAPSGPAVGVAGMRPGARGRWRPGALGVPAVDLGAADDAMWRWASRVAEMLDGPEYSPIVEPGSVRVDPVVATSQHAWGTVPMGTGTDWLGRVDGVDRLRVVDASILPTAGSSGPHETVMMVASRIADVIAADDSA